MRYDTHCRILLLIIAYRIDRLLAGEFRNVNPGNQRIAVTTAQ